MSAEMTLPEGWSIDSIDVISTQCLQKKPDTAQEFYYVDIGSIDRELKKISEPSLLMGENAPSRARKIINNGDILVSLTRPNLNAVALVPEHLDNQIASTGFEVIRPILIDNRYVFNIVRTQGFINSISGKVQGALYPAAKSSDVREYKIPIPSLPEQQQIAQRLDELLAQVDTIKARLDAIPAILKRFRQSVLSAAVSGKLTEEWRSLCGVSTDEWIKSCIGNLARVSTGKTPKRTEMKYWSEGNIPWLTSACTGTSYTEQAEQFVTELAVKECGLKMFEPGTLLLAMYGEGKTRGQISELRIKATCNQACATITVDEISSIRSFIKLCLLANYEKTREVAVGGAQPNLNLEKVREIPIHLPPKNEQIEIVRRVDHLFTFADQIEQRVNDAKTRVDKLTQSILVKAFRGELTADWRAEHPELISGENSAEALLEKIQAAKAALDGKKKKGKAA